MNKDNKILLMAVLILLVAVVSFNLGDITGKAVKERVTAISVSPESVVAGEVIYIGVNPGSEGVDQEIRFYEVEQNRRVEGATARACNRYKCFDPATVKYKTWDSWTPGEYYVRVFDRSTGNYVKAFFEIEEKYPPKGPQVHR